MVGGGRWSGVWGRGVLRLGGCKVRPRGVAYDRERREYDRAGLRTTTRLCVRPREAGGARRRNGARSPAPRAPPASSTGPAKSAERSRTHADADARTREQRTTSARDPRDSSGHPSTGTDSADGRYGAGRYPPRIRRRPTPPPNTKNPDTACPARASRSHAQRVGVAVGLGEGPQPARYLVGGPGWSGAGPAAVGTGVLPLSSNDPGGESHPRQPGAGDR